MTVKPTIIPQRVSFQLHFTGKVGLVFWKLSLDDIYRHLGQQYAARGIPLIIELQSF